MTSNAILDQNEAVAYCGNGAEIITQWLQANGVETIFGVPGDTGVALYDAFRASAPQLQHVLMNDERGAVFAADAYARRTNRPGVVEVSSGGGATFCIGGLGEALAASVPMVVISSDIHIGSRRSGALTETDQVALFAGVTKWQGQAASAEQLPAILTEAFDIAVSGRPGPTVVIVPENILDEEASVNVTAKTYSVPATRAGVAPEVITAITDGIAAARRPVVLAGGGVHWSNAYAALEDFAVAAGAPVATTIHGKGAIAESHPLSLGVVGANGGRDYATDWVAQADFVLLVGTRANSTDTDGFRAPRRDQSSVAVAIVDVDVHAKAIHNFPDALVASGDAATILNQLTEALAIDHRPSFDGEIAALSEDWRRRVLTRQVQPGTLDPWHVMERIQPLLPDNTTVVADCGTPTPYLGAFWQLRQAGRSVVTPRGHGPMGYALPASMGARYADPDSQILTFTTDGSLVMAAGALETAARNNGPVLFIHFSNGSLGWIKALQHFYHEERYFGTQLSNFDAVAVAKGFGLDAIRVHSLDDLEQAVQQGLASRRPTFIDVPTPDEHDALPPVASWQRVATGQETARPVY
jgi:acetolactate synthase I/II/III large subunit